MIKAEDAGETRYPSPNYLEFALTPHGVRHITSWRKQDGAIAFTTQPVNARAIDQQLAAYPTLLLPDGSMHEGSISHAIEDVVANRSRIEALGEPQIKLQLRYPSLPPVSVYSWREESLKGLKTIGQMVGRFDSTFPGVVGNYLTNIFLMPQGSETVESAADGRKQSGNTHIGIGGIEFFPRGFEDGAYRIPGVGNLEGVAIHEPFHFFAFSPWSSPIFADFMRAAGWNTQITEEGLIIKGKGNFVSDYAGANPGEDFCESHVALFKNLDLLAATTPLIFDFLTMRYGQDITARFERGVKPFDLLEAPDRTIVWPAFIPIRLVKRMG